MNDKDHDAAEFNSNSGFVQDGMDNPLWIGGTSAEAAAVALSGPEHDLRSGTHYASSCVSSHNNGEFSAPQFPVAGSAQNGDFYHQHQRSSETPDSVVPPALPTNMQQVVKLPSVLLIMLTIFSRYVVGVYLLKQAMWPPGLANTVCPRRPLMTQDGSD